jgi:competence protein ComEA
VSCLLLAALLLVIAAALWTDQQGEDPAAGWETLNRDIERTLKEWEQTGKETVRYPTVGGKVPINVAPAAQLETLPGIGPSRAAAIVAYRSEHGPFESLEELLEVKGIGRKTLDNLRDLITLEVP